MPRSRSSAGGLVGVLFPGPGESWRDLQTACGCWFRPRMAPPRLGMASFVVESSTNAWQGGATVTDREPTNTHTPRATSAILVTETVPRTSRRGAAILIPPSFPRHTPGRTWPATPAPSAPSTPLLVAQEPRHGIDGDPGEPLCCHPGSPPPLLDDGTELAWTVGALARWPLLALSAWQEEITLGQYMGPRDPSPSHPPQLQAFPLDLERQK